MLKPECIITIDAIYVEDGEKCRHNLADKMAVTSLAEEDGKDRTIGAVKYVLDYVDSYADLSNCTKLIISIERPN